MYVPPAFREDDLAALHATMQDSAPGEPRHRHGRGPGRDAAAAVPRRPRKAPTARSTATWPARTRNGSCRRRATPWPCSWGRTPMSAPPGTRPSGSTGRSCRPGTTSPSMPMARPSSSRTPDRLLDVVTRLTDLHERPRAEPWAVTDAPAAFIRAQLEGIVGLRLPITRIEGKRKMSQNRSAADRAGVAAGLAAERPGLRARRGRADPDLTAANPARARPPRGAERCPWRLRYTVASPAFRSRPLIRAATQEDEHDGAQARNPAGPGRRRRRPDHRRRHPAPAAEHDLPARPGQRVPPRLRLRPRPQPDLRAGRGRARGTRGRGTRRCCSPPAWRRRRRCSRRCGPATMWWPPA